MNMGGTNKQHDKSNSSLVSIPTSSNYFFFIWKYEKGLETSKKKKQSKVLKLHIFPTHITQTKLYQNELDEIMLLIDQFDPQTNKFNNTGLKTK